LTGDSFTTSLVGNWSSFSGGNSGQVYEYRNHDVGAPITRVLLKRNKLIVKGGQENFGYSLDETAQGKVTIRLVIGSLTWCADVPAKTTGDPAKNDRVDRFVGQPKSLATSCPPIP
jgi:hypothetical protein